MKANLLDEVLKKYKFYCRLTLVVEVDGEEISKQYSVKSYCKMTQIKVPLWMFVWVKVVTLYLRIRYVGTYGEVFCYTTIGSERREKK